MWVARNLEMKNRLRNHLVTSVCESLSLGAGRGVLWILYGTLGTRPRPPHSKARVLSTQL